MTSRYNYVTYFFNEKRTHADFLKVMREDLSPYFQEYSEVAFQLKKGDATIYFFEKYFYWWGKGGAKNFDDVFENEILKILSEEEQAHFIFYLNYFV